MREYIGKTIYSIIRDEYNVEFWFTDGTNLMLSAGYSDEELHVFGNGASVFSVTYNKELEIKFKDKINIESLNAALDDMKNGRITPFE